MKKDNEEENMNNGDDFFDDVNLEEGEAKMS